MSSPRNHHYVSICQQRKFFNEKTGLIYVYDKEMNNFYSKKSPKTLFSKEHLNTKELNGDIDSHSLEKELKILFEDNFPSHIKVIEEFLKKQDDVSKVYESLMWLTMLGVIGELRHPDFKIDIENKLINLETKILSKIYNAPISEVLRKVISQKKTPYLNLGSYLELALNITEKLEPIDFLIVAIESNDHFILPDTSCFQLRGQLQKYSNPFINEIIQIGVPLTDKLYILATPQILKSHIKGIFYVRDDDSKLVYKINKDLYKFSKKAIACSDMNYLKSFVSAVNEGR
jgi:hypothetical protein